MVSLSNTQWRTLAAAGERGLLVEANGDWRVSAKAERHGSLMIKVSNADGTWTHLALSRELTVVAQGYGRREVDSFEMLRRVLALKDRDDRAESERVQVDYTAIARHATQ